MQELEVRDRILLVATRLFAQKGYGSTSVREVVEAAGVTKPALYYWFANKDALFLEVVHKHLDALEQFVEDVASSEGPVRDRLARFVTQYVQGGIENIDAVKLLMTVQHPTHEDQPVVDVMSMHGRMIARFERLFQEGVERGELRPDLDVPAAVLAFIGTVNLYLMSACHGRDVPPGFTHTLIDLFLNGVAPR